MLKLIFMKKLSLFQFFAIFALGLLILGSCGKEENFNSDPGLKLGFSTDTVFFDTVFSTVGSASRIFMIYNPSKEKINISSIKLARGNNSPFRINVDGISSTEIKDFELAAKDSAFVFVKVTIDPSNANNPFIQTDSLVFSTNGNIQDVKLVAWGLDAHFYRNVIIGSNYTFLADKPHVIYGVVIVDSLYTLTIAPGSRVHMHSGSALVIYRDASLKINGTKEDPVIIEGDRLEPYYKDISGQWGRIWLYAGSINNEINYAIIKNGQIGVHADTTGNSPNPTLRISNTQIYNMSYTGILGQGTTIEAGNCVIGNCGNSSVALTLGGKYDFRNCTIGNYWNRSFRRGTAVVLNNYYIDTTNTVNLRPLEMAYFGNCVIYGDKSEEITIDQYKNEGVLNYKFDHCLLKTELNITDAEKFPNSLKNQNPWFKDPSISAFQPDSTLSSVINKGSISILSPFFINLNQDIKGNLRTADAAPDLGAYEFQEGEVRRKRW